MLTIFALPKPFRGHINIIQRNAIKSWTLMKPECEIILFGDDEGVAEVAAELGLRHISSVKKTEFGTPLISDVFDQANNLAKNDILCYLNSDIILMNDFTEAVKIVAAKKEKYLCFGRHWKMEIVSLIEFGNDWADKMLQNVQQEGIFASTNSMDYFIFPKTLKIDMPPFAVGRPLWDTWLAYHARLTSIPLIDITEAVKVVHQNHDYKHVPKATGNMWDGPEAENNRKYYTIEGDNFGIRDAIYKLTASGKIKYALDKERILRSMVTIPLFHPKLAPLFIPHKAGSKFYKWALDITRPVRHKIRDEIRKKRS